MLNTNVIPRNCVYTSTVCDIRDTGAVSLGDALKSNKTLTQLNLSSENKKKKNIAAINQQSTLSFSFSQQTTTLEKQEQHH